MKVVYKYPVPPTDHFTLDLPAGAVPLCLATQRDQMMLWALVDPDRAGSDTEPRRFRLAGTGHPIEDDENDGLRYIGTCQLHGGALIFHLFELMPRPAREARL